MHEAIVYFHAWHVGSGARHDMGDELAARAYRSQGDCGCCDRTVVLAPDGVRPESDEKRGRIER